MRSFLAVRLFSTEAASQAKLAAFSARSGIQLPIETLKAALTYKKDLDPLRYQFIGQRCAELYTSEYILFKYPKLPAEAVESALRSYTGVTALTDTASTFGLGNVMNWQPVADEKGRTGERIATTKVLMGLIGAIYMEQVIFWSFPPSNANRVGPQSCANFYTETYFESRGWHVVAFESDSSQDFVE